MVTDFSPEDEMLIKNTEL